MAEMLTSTEVAALLGLSERSVRKEVEHGLFGSAKPPRFALPALVYFRALVRLGLQLGTEDRERLYRAIQGALAKRKRPERIEIGPLVELKLGEVTEEVEEILKDFSAWKKRLVVDDRILGGEPVFPKSRLSVRHVGAMLQRGASAEVVREDYPYLTDRDLTFAKLFAEAYPRVGRPREHHDHP